MRFADRDQAGRLLGRRVEDLELDAPVVVGLPRGGVVVAAAVATALRAPLEVLVVRKLGYPLQPELGVGAIAEGGARVTNEGLLVRLELRPGDLEEVVRRETSELERRVRRYRGDRPLVPMAGRTVVLVDDGLATGYTARAAVAALRRAGAARVVVAVPVGAPDTVAALGALADDVVCLAQPSGFFSIGEWYEDFHQVSDDEVQELLPPATAPAVAGGDGPPLHDRQPARGGPVTIPVGSHRVTGDLAVPGGASGMVLFAHGSGSSRLSPRNRAVAQALNAAGLGTLLFDLLTDDEAAARENVFDVGLLAARLVLAVHWAREQPESAGLPVGLFGASTGAAAALVAAAELGDDIRAVVSRGGRPDLAGPRLAEVRCPVLLVVGGRDEVVLALNRDAAGRLRCEHRLEVVPGATHLFEEPGALDAVARLAAGFFATAFGRARVTEVGRP